ncbi:hypothetical protein Clacol_002378 [Clathrus columnatus]|uniref:Uncharacterized protein n=1 Tax=Clathrus columnatus TaxID=1419009 RepID=A0AAV5A8D9_9AGAM|nr:hypothetical protein Clacol_002378 [Clathrus columnatus]
MSTSLPTNQPPTKVFGVGLGRTGSLHRIGETRIWTLLSSITRAERPGKMARMDQDPGSTFLQGQTDPEFVGSVLKGFNSAVDTPVSFVADTLNKIYPDAKFILTTRDLDKWVESNMATLFNPQAQSLLLPVFERIQKRTLTDEDRNFLASIPNGQGLWFIAARSRPNMIGKRPIEDLPEEFLNHTAWIKEVIPSEKLLVFDVKEGWGPLVEFLGVPEPEEPFPRVNEAAEMAKRVQESQILLRQLQNSK